MEDINIADAEIFHTGIGVGGEGFQMSDWD
jgi:hypothetical protein